jgi:predicted  nucleic acid-binding Zn-ribbon protein
MLSGLEGIHIKLELMDLDQQIIGINNNMTSILYTLDGFENNRIKDLILDLGLSIGNANTDISNLDNRVTILESKPDYSNDISNINNDITNLNDNMTSVLYILDGLQNTHVKEAMRELGFIINDIRNELSERITACERKLEEHDNILADILSRLTHAGISTKIK